MSRRPSWYPEWMPNPVTAGLSLFAISGATVGLNIYNNQLSDDQKVKNSRKKEFLTIVVVAGVAGIIWSAVPTVKHIIDVNRNDDGNPF